MGRIENHTGGEAGLAGVLEQTFQPHGIELNVAVQNCHPGRVRRAPAPIDSSGEAGILAHLNHVDAGARDGFRNTALRSVIDNQHPFERHGLVMDRGDQPGEKIQPVVNGYDRRDLIRQAGVGMIRHAG